MPRVEDSRSAPGSVESPVLAWATVAVLVIAFRDLATYDALARMNRGAADFSDILMGASTSYPPLALALALFSLFLRRDRALAIRNTNRMESFLGLSMFGLSLAVVAWVSYVDSPHLLAPAAALAVIGGALARGGAGAAKASLVPAAFLVFAIPISPTLSHSMVYGLQEATGTYTSLLLDLIGRPHGLSGDLIFEGENTFQVIEGCSGFRSIMILTMTSIFYTELLSIRGLRRILLFVGSPFLAFSLNGPRVLSIVLYPESIFGQDHTLQGLAVIVLGVVLLGLIDLALERWGVGVSPPLEAPPSALPHHPNPRAAALFSLAAAGLLVVAPLAVGAWTPVRQGPFALIGFPTIHADWKRASAPFDARFNGSVMFDEHVGYRYTKPNDEWVEVFIGVDHRLVSERAVLSPRIPIPAPGWEVIERHALPDHPETYGRERLDLQRGRAFAYSEGWFEGVSQGGLAAEFLINTLGLDHSRFRRPESVFAVRLVASHDGTVPGRSKALTRLEQFSDAIRKRLDSANRTRFVHAEP